MELIFQAGCIKAGLTFHDNFLTHIFTHRYDHNILHRGNPDITVDISSREDLTSTCSEQIDVHAHQNGWSIESDAIRCRYNTDEKHAVIEVSGDEDRGVDSLENGLRVFFQYVFINKGSFMAHASSVGRASVCVLFTAGQGGGKTTLSELCSRAGADVYGDDLVLIRPGPEQIELFSLPFRGETDIDRFDKGPVELREVFFLEKSQGWRISPVDPAESTARLMSNIPFISTTSGDVMQQVLAMAAAVAGIDTFRLAYDLSSGVEHILMGRIHEYLEEY